MSKKELDRLLVVEKCAGKALPQLEGAQMLGISVRQPRRLINRFRAEGASALASKHRDRPANNKISDAIRQHALELIRTHYSDFAPTLAHEYLSEQHGFKFSVETLRKWMIAEGIWRAKKHRASIHQSRERRPCYGELVQIDGSPHDWFEGRADKCTLIVFIDDATGALMQCHFTSSETTEAYMSINKPSLDGRCKPWIST